MIYSVTPYTRYEIRPMRVRWKMSEFYDTIPKEYRRLIPIKTRFFKGSGVTAQTWDNLDDPEILKRCRQYAKYHEMFLKTRYGYKYIQPFIDTYFTDLDKALEYVKNFDDEHYYYKWLKLSIIYTEDEPKPEFKKDDYEYLANTPVPKSDRWFQFEITSVGDEIPSWVREYTSEFKEAEPPEYLKVFF